MACTVHIGKTVCIYWCTKISEFIFLHLFTDCFWLAQLLWGSHKPISIWIKATSELLKSNPIQNNCISGMWVVAKKKQMHLCWRLNRDLHETVMSINADKLTSEAFVYKALHWALYHLSFQNIFVLYILMNESHVYVNIHTSVNI